ncbi:MAG: penicillin acylase family protein, partial [Flavisolibacter sp.]
MRYLLILLLFPINALSQQFSPQEISRYEKQAKNVTIIRDNWGVPHIYGKTDADAVFGLMYAQCEENFNQVEENNLEMLGRLSEKYGISEFYNDLQMQLIYDTSAAKKDYSKSLPWFRKLLDACADGVNYYLYKHPEVKPAIIFHFEPWFALLRTDGSISATQFGGLTVQDTRALFPLSNPTSFIPNEHAEPIIEPTGSNGFAIAPSRTKSKNAILYINPHVTFYFRTEVQMVSEEGLNSYGAVTWGNFFVYQGFNEHCGWMHTSSYADVADLYKEKSTIKGDSLFYEYDGRWIPATAKKISVNYKENGQLKEQQYIAWSTIHGPVLGLRNGVYLSLKENNRSLDALMQSWLRTKSKGFEDFKRIMNMRSNNSNNTVFADDKGNIAYWHGNFMPRRDTKFDFGLPVDGSISATNWKGIHTLDEVVHVYNPASGWIQNCNSTPFTVAGESSPRKSSYPEYMAPDGQNFRALNAAKLLENAKNISQD